jgi:hypothetical protein
MQLVNYPTNFEYDHPFVLSQLNSQQTDTVKHSRVLVKTVNRQTQSNTAVYLSSKQSTHTVKHSRVPIVKTRLHIIFLEVYFCEDMSDVTVRSKKRSMITCRRVFTINTQLCLTVSSCWLFDQQNPLKLAFLNVRWCRLNLKKHQSCTKFLFAGEGISCIWFLKAGSH